MLQNKHSFHSLEYYRNSLNTLGSLADFVYDVSTELLSYADELRTAEDSDEDSQTAAVPPGEVARLRALALDRKQKASLLQQL